MELDAQNAPAAKVAAVTGGASGLGAAVVAQLAHLGYRVAVMDIQMDAARQLVDELNGKSLPVRWPSPLMSAIPNRWTQPFVLRSITLVKPWMCWSIVQASCLWRR